MPSYTGTASQVGKGTQFAIDTSVSGGPTYTMVGEIVSATQDGQQNGTVDATNMESTYREFIGTIPDGGTFKITFNRIPEGTDTGQVAIQSAFSAAIIKAFQITMPKAAGQSAGDTYTFNGLVQDLNLGELSNDKIIQQTATIKVSNAITFAAGETS